MVKKIFPLIIVSSLISAGLLYLGFMILGQYTPAHASSLKALVADSTLQDSVAPVNAADSSLSGKGESGEKESRPVSPAAPAAPVSLDTSTRSQSLSETTSTGSAPVTGITIAELLKNPGLHDDLVLTITGIATSLNSEKFLLNDGTGQILVEVEDEMVSLSNLNGLSVTVTGKFELSRDSTLAKLEARSLTFQGQTIIVDDLDDDDDDLDDDEDSGEDLDDDGDVDDDDGDDDHDGSGGGNSGPGSGDSGSGGGDD
ncbi:MAG: hypothetical protein A2136_03605 [Chloroflexi bacterium RBG_16_54_11]|nr:MAG: hypothetical protein A2136_03605 [Chloroflexi bacterium RBG_16_54_11]